MSNAKAHPIDISKISDDVLEAEYSRRFSFQEGAEYVRSSDTASRGWQAAILDKPRDQEHFGVMFLNGQNRIIKVEVMFTGSLTSSAVYPREVIKRTLDLEAAAVIFFHNHPSGSMKPSIHDRKVTEKLQTALEAIDVRLLDHLIIPSRGGGYFSFAEQELL